MRILVVAVALLALSCVPDPLSPEEYVGGTLPIDDTGAPDEITPAPDVSDTAEGEPDEGLIDMVEPPDVIEVSDEGPDPGPEVSDEGPDAGETDGGDTPTPDAEDTDDSGEPDTCVADCEDRECGPDGCGEVCGVCLVGEECNETFQCEEPCEPQCTGKFCGPDGCGAACGICMDGFECGIDGKCYDVTCVPDCSGKVCGDNGCGSDCGTCATGDVCIDGACQDGPCTDIPPTGKCEGDELWSCVDDLAEIANCASQPGKICGWDPNKGSYGCIEKPICTPQCAGKQCGSDGCDGVCGVCPGGWACQVGTCKGQAGGECGFYNAIGTCEDNVLYYCDAAKLFVQDCTDTGETCGFDPEASVNQCLD